MAACLHQRESACEGRRRNLLFLAIVARRMAGTAVVRCRHGIAGGAHRRRGRHGRAKAYHHEAISPKSCKLLGSERRARNACAGVDVGVSASMKPSRRPSRRQYHHGEPLRAKWHREMTLRRHFVNRHHRLVKAWRAGDVPPSRQGVSAAETRRAA